MDETLPLLQGRRGLKDHWPQVFTFCLSCGVMSAAWGATGETIDLMANRLGTSSADLDVIYVGSGVGSVLGSLIGGPTSLFRPLKFSLI